MIQKKAQGLSLNMVVIAVLVLIVLVVVLTLIVSKIGLVSKADTCENQGGKCIPSTNNCEDLLDKDYTAWTLKKCPDLNGKKQTCCFPDE